MVAFALAWSTAHAAGVQHQPPQKLSDTGLYGDVAETRYIEKTGKDTWIFATYVWDDQQREATLAPAGTGLKDHVEIAPGMRHDIPSVSDCKACHEGMGRDSVLGFGALQLSPARDPLAPSLPPPIRAPGPPLATYTAIVATATMTGIQFLP
jgi:hypothetical protein